METFYVVLFGFLIVNFIADIVYIYTKNKYIKLIEKQNKALWDLNSSSNDIHRELVKANLRKGGGQFNE